MTPSPRTLARADVDTYRRDGHVVVHEMFGAAEVRAWTDEWRQLAGGGGIADRLDPILDVSPLFEGLAGDPRLVAAVGSLLDGSAIPFKAKIIMKQPGTAGYGLHQDYPYWEWLGLGADEYVNATIAFDPFDASNGSLEIFSGLQHERLPARARSRRRGPVPQHAASPQRPKSRNAVPARALSDLCSVPLPGSEPAIRAGAGGSPQVNREVLSRSGGGVGGRPGPS